MSHISGCQQQNVNSTLAITDTSTGLSICHTLVLYHNCRTGGDSVVSVVQMVRYNCLTSDHHKCQSTQRLHIGLEVDRISVSVMLPNVDKWALSADIRFGPKAVESHSVQFRFRRAAVGKFGGCRK